MIWKWPICGTTATPSEIKSHPGIPKGLTGNLSQIIALRFHLATAPCLKLSWESGDVPTIGYFQPVLFWISTIRGGGLVHGSLCLRLKLRRRRTKKITKRSCRTLQLKQSTPRVKVPPLPPPMLSLTLNMFAYLSL